MGSYVKFHTSHTPSGHFVLARLFAGESAEQSKYAGTLVLPSELWERILDCMVYGASQMGFSGERLEVYFGPDEEMVGEDYGGVDRQVEPGHGF